MRLWLCRASAGLFLSLLFLLGWTRAILADPEMDAHVREIVTQNLAPLTTDHPGGVAAAAYVAGRVQFFNFGLADEAQKRPVTSDTLFNVASLRKLFEATLVALGVLRGELRLDDPVSKYVTELHGDYISQVTIGQLAAHTSGLLLSTDHPPWPNASYSLAEFIDMLNAWTPHAGEGPGKQRIYSHAGYVLLQLALERRYGVPIAQLVESRILTPLGMHSTLIPERGRDNRAIMPSELMQKAVQGYAEDGTPIGPPGNQQSYFDFPGTGQMFSTARDLVTFMKACIDGKVADPQLREALRMTQAEAFHIDRTFGQAMAWENINLGDAAIVDKPGGLNNASAYMGLVPARRIGLLLLANRGEFSHEIGRYHILPALARQ
ncbi:serine hydrolase [Bradyrhizobium sp. CB3481]|uniref:serine hydrolase n=1 Tax=Bradyrhizobium sp. CB3481 TaxID=3039158 RepID=UPI0024B24C13|nr:serine hydrolase [Bradyrhizobium sp. CB3481]WFU17193.1 serine hydrolase [Bradyrhizobium sp. CB3481]